MFGLDSTDPFLVNATTSTKRPRLNHEEIQARRTCLADKTTIKNEVKFDDKHPAIDVVINVAFLDVLCACEGC